MLPLGGQKVVHTLVLFTLELPWKLLKFSMGENRELVNGIKNTLNFDYLEVNMNDKIVITPPVLGDI